MSKNDSWYATELDPRCQVLVFPAPQADDPDPDPGEAAAA